MKYIDHNRGFALIFSVVVVAVVTIVTLSTSALTRKSLDLSSSGIESQEAFYAADAGIECALYWDIAQRAGNYFRDGNALNDNVACFGVITTGYTCTATICRNLDLGEKQARFEINIIGPDTEIDSSGYNSSLSSTPLPTERGLRVEY